jgi:hypothetical protein
LTIGQQAVHFDRQLEEMSTAQMQVGTSKKLLYISDSAATMQLLAKAGALPARGLQYFISILNT